MSTTGTITVDVKRYRRIKNRYGEATMIVWTESDNPRIEKVSTFKGNPGAAVTKLYDHVKFWNPSTTVIIDSSEGIEVVKE